jgi:prevent-host-death family protein
MKTVTFSQFRNNAKRYIDAVEKGETFEIYRYGKPVAVISPYVKETPRDLSRWKTANPIKIPGVFGSKYILEDRRKSRF